MEFSNEHLLQKFEENIKNKDLNSHYMKRLLRDAGSALNEYNFWILSEVTTQFFEIIDEEYNNWDICVDFVEKNLSQIYNILERYFLTYYDEKYIKDILKNIFWKIFQNTIDKLAKIL